MGELGDTRVPMRMNGAPRPLTRSLSKVLLLDAQ
jgi:hypothetical protein